MSHVSARRSEKALRRQVGARLKELRFAKNYSQEALAEDLGIAHSTLSAYEVGSRAITLDRLADFARYFNVPITELLTRDCVEDAHSASR